MRLMAILKSDSPELPSAVPMGCATSLSMFGKDALELDPNCHMELPDVVSELDSTRFARSGRLGSNPEASDSKPPDLAYGPTAEGPATFRPCVHMVHLSEGGSRCVAPT